MAQLKKKYNPYLTYVRMDSDGTADLFIKTNMSEDQIYNWIENNYVNRDYFTGWDLTDSGFYINFDVSHHWFQANQLRSAKKFVDYIKKFIKEFEIPLKWNSKTQFKTTLFRQGD